MARGCFELAGWTTYAMTASHLSGDNYVSHLLVCVCSVVK